MLEKTLRVHWRGGSSKQSILKEINSEYSLEGLMLKLKLQYFGYLMQSVDSLEKTPEVVKMERRRGRGWQRVIWLDGTICSTDMNLSKLREMVEDREAWHAAVHGVAKSRKWLSEWITTKFRSKAPPPTHSKLCWDIGFGGSWGSGVCWFLLLGYLWRLFSNIRRLTN